MEPAGWTLRSTKGTFFFAAATFNQGHEHPTASSQQLYSQGLQTLTNPATIASAAPQDWIPAYCAHALSDFNEEHLPLLRTPDMLQSFSASIATPILEQNPDQAQDYFQSVITAYDRSWQPTTRRHRVRPVAGPPDDTQCLCFLPFPEFNECSVLLDLFLNILYIAAEQFPLPINLHLSTLKWVTKHPYNQG